MKILGSSAFVTGGANGIGANLSEKLLKAGANVYMADINGEQGRVLETKFRLKYGEDKATFLKCDVTNEEQFSEAFNSAVGIAGHIDLMINNAGIMHENKWKSTVDVNLNGVILGTNLAVAHMRIDKGGKGGVIINTGSISAFALHYTIPVYAATKAAIMHFTTCWAANPNVAEMGIRFSCVHPVAADTQISRFVSEDQTVYHDEINKRLNSLHLLPVDKVSDAFMKVIENDDSTITHLHVTTEDSHPIKLDVIHLKN